MKSTRPLAKTGNDVERLLLAAGADERPGTESTHRAARALGFVPRAALVAAALATARAIRWSSIAAWSSVSLVGVAGSSPSWRTARTAVDRRLAPGLPSSHPPPGAARSLRRAGRSRPCPQRTRRRAPRSTEHPRRCSPKGSTSRIASRSRDREPIACGKRPPRSTPRASSLRWAMRRAPSRSSRPISGASPGVSCAKRRSFCGSKRSFARETARPRRRSRVASSRRTRRACTSIGSQLCWEGCRSRRRSELVAAADLARGRGRRPPGGGRSLGDRGRLRGRPHLAGRRPARAGRPPRRSTPRSSSRSSPRRAPMTTSRRSPPIASRSTFSRRATGGRAPATSGAPAERNRATHGTRQRSWPR